MGEIVTSLRGSVTTINSSNFSSMRLTLVFSRESSGVTARSLGGVTSLSPPVGGTIFAHPARKPINSMAAKVRIVEGCIGFKNSING